MNKFLIGALVLITLVVGVFFLISNSQKTNTGEIQEMMQKSDSGTESEKMEGKKVEGYQAKVLAGNSSPFLEFNKADYEKAKSEGKIILLDFYATWCPI